MVLSVITLAATVPMIATSTLQLQDSAQDQKLSSEEAALKSDKCNIRVRATARMSDERKRIVSNAHLALSGQKLYLDDGWSRFHRFAGYFLEYPGQAHDGLVSTIDSQNMLNWIYVDPTTYEVKYGVREVSDQHLSGPMGLVSRTVPPQSEEQEANDGSPVERRYTFNGWEGFALVEESKDVWSLYFDKDDDGLKGKVQDKRVTEVELVAEPLPLPLR